MIKPEKIIEMFKEGSPVTIAALGDSLTSGWLVKKGYLDYLQEMLLNKYPRTKLNIINRGVPGDTARGGRERIEKDILTGKPDAVFVQFALNDAFTGYSPSEFRENIQEIIDRVNEDTEAEIILITSTYLGFGFGGDAAKTFYNVLESISEKNKISIVRVDEYWKKNIVDRDHFLNFVLDDHLHPNENGYKLMAEAIMEIF